MHIVSLSVLNVSFIEIQLQKASYKANKAYLIQLKRKTYLIYHGLLF